MTENENSESVLFHYFLIKWALHNEFAQNNPCLLHLKAFIPSILDCILKAFFPHLSTNSRHIHSVHFSDVNYFSQFDFSATLFCSIVSHSSVRWINQDNKLIADSRNPQYVIANRNLHPNGSLEVTNIKLDDTGDYICEVMVGGLLFKQLNSIEVQGMACWRR